MAQGKGISAAVRETIGGWITEELVDLLWNELKDKGSMTKPGFARRLRTEEDWVRRTRTRMWSGWQRSYDCKQFATGPRTSRVGLQVHTNEVDTHISFVTFRVDGKLVGGGRVRVPSVNINEYASYSDRQIKRTGETATFRPFTTDELQKIENQMRCGDEAIRALFEERY
jgi:hypothetical protein